jgi:hypothetical protein
MPVASQTGLIALAIALVVAVSLTAQVKVEKVSCLGLPNCLKLSNGDVEVVVTTDIGPRISRYSFVGGENILAELPGSSEKKNEWQSWGGHRVWIAPEGRPRSYGPDNAPIEHTVSRRTVRLVQPVEPSTRIQKAIIVTLDERGSGVMVQHALTNQGSEPFELAPWALTIMNGGGTAIVPQEPYKKHQDALLPARAIALWHYTNLADPRFAIGPKFIRLSTDAARREPQKIGVLNKTGWAGYARQGTLFVKQYPFVEGATYPDYGVNTEVFTQGTFIELETLGPLTTLAPGTSAEHTERWQLHRDVQLGTTEEAIEKAIGARLSAR